jgi:hypothetical protein
MIKQGTSLGPKIQPTDRPLAHLNPQPTDPWHTSTRPSRMDVSPASGTVAHSTVATGHNMWAVARAPRGPTNEL